MSPQCSVITPLHRAANPFVEETYKSLLAQTITDWEWVVLENRGGRIPRNARGDVRVRVFSHTSRRIGGLKRRLCEVSRAEWIVELDADDLLVPTALELLAQAFQSGADFVYSNFAEFHEGSWQPNVYHPAFGWRARPFDYHGHPLIEMIAPPATAHNLRYVDWSPNHVRAWTRASYDEVGGHDPERAVMDDHHLIVRYYLAGKRFEHVNECLYLYRIHGENTVRLQNAAIRQGTEQVYNEYIWKLAETWTARQGLLLVDLGGGLAPTPGYLILDRQVPDGRVGKACNLERRWPLKDSSVGLLRAHDVLEHLPDPVHAMSEAYRVLAPGGWFFIHVPSALGQGAYQDPTHKSFWVRNSFLYYTHREWAKYIPHFQGRFQSSRVLEWFPSEWHREYKVPYVEAHLICLKDGYAPMGAVNI